MQAHYQALADKAAHNAAFALTDEDRDYWMSACAYYTCKAIEIATGA